MNDQQNYDINSNNDKVQSLLDNSVIDKIQNMSYIKDYDNISKTPKKNLSQLQKYKIVTLIQNKIDIKTDKMPSNGWMEIAARYNKSVKTIRNVWNEFKKQSENNFIDDEILKPKAKGRVPSQIDEHTCESIKTIISDNQRQISYRLIKLTLEAQYNIFLSVSTVYHYCQKIQKSDSKYALINDGNPIKKKIKYDD